MKTTKTILAALLLTVACVAKAATVSDLVAIGGDWTFVADGYTADGTAGLIKNFLYAGDRIFTPTGNTAAANKGTSTFGGGTHKNSMRLKNVQDRLAFKVTNSCTVTFYTQSHASRGIVISKTDRTSVEDAYYQQQPASTPVWEVELDEAGTYYLSNYGGDFYMAGFVFDFAEGTNIYNVSFNAGGASGVTPATLAVDAGNSVTIPTYNRTLYKDGYTLTGWSDGVTTYAPGATFTPSSNTELTAVFTANTYSINQSLTELTVRWDFQRQNGAPTVQWEQRTGDFLVTQTTVNGYSVDVKMDVNTSSGKFANASWDDWAQINGGTLLTFPSKNGSTVQTFSMSEPTGTTLDENAYDSYSSYVTTFSTTNTSGSSVLTIDGGSYYRYVDVTYPVTVVGASISDAAISEQTTDAGDDTDWKCDLPYAYSAENTTITITKSNGTVTATALDDAEGSVTVTKDGDNFTIPTPAVNHYTTVTFTLSPNDGAIALQTTYTYRVTHVGTLSLTSVTVDGVSIDVLTDINNSATSYTATYSGCYTTAPTVAAVQNDDASATVDAPSISGSTYTYTIHGSLGGGVITRDYTLILDNVHVYASEVGDNTVNLKYTGDQNDKENKIWSNGSYSLSPVGDGWNNSGFKLKASEGPFTLTMPSDVQVKQFIIHEFIDNYAVGSFNTITSESMTAYIPVKHNFGHQSGGGAAPAKYNLIINLEDHQPGEPIVFSFTGGSQITGWYELTVANQNPGTAPTSTAQTATISDNDAVVAVTFDREIANDVTATIGGNSVKAKGGAAVLYFPVWNLNYSTNYTLTIAAGAATDNYGNSTSSAIEVAVNIPAKSAVAMSTYDYVVSNVSEFTAAISAVNSSNTSSSSTRKTIFIKNGNYDLGTEVGTGKSLVQLKCYNVSLIGESRDGVILYGETDGISNPVLNLRDKTGFYLQDLTVKNTHDYGTGLFDGGVAVAVYGGDKTIMKNVRMLSNQDTQVTGHRAYFEDCAIHGTVDFICGGGDNFYYRTDLVLENRGGNCITAPSTNSSQHWGYVFDHCTIKAVDATAATTNEGSYSLGRPWQNEPRAYYLNTDMQVLCATAGWAGMSTLTTHFYEYNTLHNGSAVDLSGRENSPTSVNTYTPVLSSSEAAQFSVHNVLGGTDAWDPAADVAQVAAPQNISASARTLKWNAVADAKLYVILLNGEYVTNTTSTTYDVSEDGVYTVKAANKFGGLGAASAAVTISTGTYVRAFANRYLNTLCFPYQIDSYTGATFYTLQYKEMDGEDVTNVVLEEHVGALEAATPYFYLPDDGEDELVCEYSGDEVATPSTVNGVVGIYAKQTVPTNDYVTYQGQIRKVGTGVSLHEYRAYIHMDDVSSTPVAPKYGRRRLLIRNADSHQTPTDVETIFESSNPQIFKYIKEGQLLILRDGRTYNAQGQLVQ